VMDGEIGSMIETLRIADNAEKLKAGKWIRCASGLRLF
jgi:hypothetical protein